MALLIKYLEYIPNKLVTLPELEEEEEEAAADDLQKLKAEICEIATLYSLRYLDAFGEGGYLGPFVEKTWGLLTTIKPGFKYDLVRFLFLPNFLPSRLYLILFAFGR